MSLRSSKIKMAVAELGDVNIHISGSGLVRLSGTAKSLETRVSGSGSIDCSKLVTDEAGIHIAGSGSAKVYAARSVSASISGSGHASYTGGATEIKKHISGSGWFGKMKGTD